MLIFSTHTTTRLQYIVDFISKQISNEEWLITNDELQFASFKEAKINYSNKAFDDCLLQIQPDRLLFEEDIKPQSIICSEKEGLTIFFQNESETGFDIFAASFYLISRYEEYIPHKKDKHGRYSHENSLASQQNFLQQPLVNIWLQNFRQIIIKYFPSLTAPKQAFSFLPTYDIDMAWSYLHKGVWRNTGGFFRDALKLDFNACKERIRVLSGQQYDPYYNFDRLHQLHLLYNIKPKYFFLVAEKKSKKDKNISPKQIAMRKLIATISKQYSIGLHPSWQSGDNLSMLKKEKNMLSSIPKTQITASRQHYLRFTLPTTYQQLTKVGIEEDYSMGYAAVNGFRASVASPFYWFDLSKNKSTNLRIYPFCFMDATSIHYKNHTHKQAFAEMLQLYKTVKNVGGLYCILWHNDTFSNTDWASAYKELISIAAK